MKTNECEVVVVAAAGRNEAEKLAALRIIVTRLSMIERRARTAGSILMC